MKQEEFSSVGDGAWETINNETISQHKKLSLRSIREKQISYLDDEVETLKECINWLEDELEKANDIIYRLEYDLPVSSYSGLCERGRR
jgi:predicted  nucleic acid-binding Zn-ribbon protein